MGGIKSLVLVINAVVCFLLIASLVFVLIPFSHPVTNAGVTIDQGILNKVSFSGRDAFDYNIDIFNSTSISTYVSSAITFIAHQLNILIGAPATKFAVTFVPISNDWRYTTAEIALIQPRTVDDNYALGSLQDSKKYFNTTFDVFVLLSPLSDIELIHPIPLQAPQKHYLPIREFPIYFIGLPVNPNNLTSVVIEFGIYVEPDEVVLFGKSMYILFAILILFAISASSAIDFSCTSCFATCCKSCCAKAKSSNTDKAGTAVAVPKVIELTGLLTTGAQANSV
jgi:hypothetical protein